MLRLRFRQAIKSPAWLAVPFAFSLVGCAVAPPVLPNGLPRISRYTNVTQVDWALSKYQDAQAGSPTADDACLGWERMVFDLQSAAAYPAVLRMSTESANLMMLEDALPELIRRHPRPAVCGLSSSTMAQPPEAPPTPEQAAPPAAGLPQAGQGEGSGSMVPAAPTPPRTFAPPPPASRVAHERELLSRMRAALRMPESTTAAPQTSIASGVDLKTLMELADHEIPTIRLRARFHLLGQCVLAVDAADRYLTDGAGTPGHALCAQAAGVRESLPIRQAQRRLLRSMLQAWRGKHPEPMTDLVQALASYASRDNPVLDGPRPSR